MISSSMCVVGSFDDDDDDGCDEIDDVVVAERRCWLPMLPFPIGLVW